MAVTRPEIELLRVARIGVCNTQQAEVSSPAARNTPATSAQQPGLKALALLVLARNTSATAAQQRGATPTKTAQQQRSNGSMRATAAAGLRIVEFRLVGDRPGAWHTALGPDTDDLLRDLRERFRDRLEAARPKAPTPRP